MCEINPKHKKFFRLEFFSTVEMPERLWQEATAAIANHWEQEVNKGGPIRCHIHEIEDEGK